MDSSGWKSKRVIFGDDPHGCPNLTTEIKGYTIQENAILIESGGEPERDVTDFCMTFNPLIKYDDTITFSITETANDETSINEIAMFQATVEKGREVAVTGDGNTIDYIPDPSKTKATLNNLDISEKLSLKDNETEKIKKGDKLLIEFDRVNDEDLIVLRIRTIGIKNHDGAMVTTSTGENIKLKFRNGFDMVVIEPGKKPFNGFELEALQELEVDQVLIVKNEKTSVVKQLKLLDAFNDQGNVNKLISYTDKHYAYVSNGNPLTFNFENVKDPGKEVFYYFKFEGRYEASSEGNGKISGDSEKKYEFNLFENQPNPFNPVTKIRYEIPEAGLVKLTVYDISGREIKTLVDEFKAAGIHESVFDGSNLASGVYFYKLHTAMNNTTKRMILIK
ncbi:MAG: T9SS type A sorting domain-containing protein [Ignavibacteria bacterium]|nr:T9SS type A sorting domain-containing protein [Ignavibacteria bacterium]